jgi:hypothetical protein
VKVVKSAKNPAITPSKLKEQGSAKEGDVNAAAVVCT